MQEDFLKKPCFIPSAALFIGFAVAFAPCQENGLFSRVVKNYSGDVSLSTSFDVKILWKIREKEETKHGKIALAPHGRFRIDLGESVWICDGTTLWQYDKSPSPPQVIIRLVSSCDPSQLPSGMLSKYLTRYSFKAMETKGKSAVFAWTLTGDSSAAQKGDVARITVTVDAKSASVRELVVVDKSGNASDYTFHGAAFGPQHPGAFSFNIPKGSRVVDER